MHHVVLDDTSVFSSGGGNESVGIEFKVDIDFTYFLIKEKIGQVHKELASSYQDIVTSRARDAIKNEAASVKTADYFLERQNVEKRFREAIVLKWNTPPALPCVLDQLYLGRITISDSVAEKQLDSVIQNERNEMEASLQRAAIERELTAVEVNTITLQKEKLLRIAAAEANLLTTRATVEAARIVQDSQTNGTSFLFQTVGISNQEHMATFDYIRSLMNRESLTMDVSYLSADNVLRTLAVS